MKKYIAAIEHAASQTARVMGAQLRQSAINDGWHPEAASSLNVSYEDGKFVAKSASDNAFVHEYGKEGVPPKASVRKYGKNSAQHASGVFKHVLNNNLDRRKR